VTPALATPAPAVVIPLPRRHHDTVVDATSTAEWAAEIATWWLDGPVDLASRVVEAVGRG
jgi:hypothetical protein